MNNSNDIIIGDEMERFDLKLLLGSRLLIQASSGGGKSYLLRRIAEECQGMVQTIIIDPEGEFASLREKFNFVLAGPGGETTVDPFSAALLAHKLMEIGASAICDISELKHNARHEWVRNFLDALIELPKKLWHPVILVVDEAHLFAPEKGQGESVAFQAMANIASMGRKRGICAVFATQRLSKFSKNVSAELHNVLIGMTFQDLDCKRAAETLGVLKSDEKQFISEIKVLDPGTFFALGRAISKTIIKFKVASVITSHPKVGKLKTKVQTKTPDKIKALLPQLQDLPQQAQARARTEAELRAEVNKLNGEIKDLKKAQPKALPAQVKKVNVVSDKQISRVEKIIESMRKLIDQQQVYYEQSRAKLSEASKELSITVSSGQHMFNVPLLKKRIEEIESPGFRAGVKAMQQRIAAEKPANIQLERYDFDSPGLKTTAKIAQKMQDHNTAIALSKAEKAILTVLAQSKNGNRPKNALALIAGYTHSGGGFNNALSSLRSKGMIVTDGDFSAITDHGIQSLGTFERLPEGHDLLQYWIRKSSKAEATILQVLSNTNTMDKEELAIACDYEVKGGGFNNALSSLRTIGLISGSAILILSEELI